MAYKPFEFALTGGLIRHNLERQAWVCWSDSGGKIGEVDENAFPTIREFKQWGQELINTENTP